MLAIRMLPLRRRAAAIPTRRARAFNESPQRPVSLVVEGEETEAGKAIVEMLFEPLLHIVRNAIDHGVEESERARATRQTARRRRSGCARRASTTCSSGWRMTAAESIRHASGESRWNAASPVED